MLMSMTAFGRTTRDFDWGTLSVELSTVNHRYQDISVRLPRELSFMESQVQDMLRKRVKRGKIRAKVDMNLSTSLKAVPVDHKVLSKYYVELEKIRSELNMKEEIRIENLLDLPGVLQSEGLSESFLDTMAEDLKETVDDAADTLIAMRSREGEDLQKDILQNLESYRKNMEKIETEWEQAKEEAVNDLCERINKILEDKRIFADESRLAQEIAIMADKWDISEEISRTWSHIEKLEGTVHSEESVGRKLDFLLQEMNREINTIASKISNARIRWLAVEGKTYLERIREQVQNVE